MILVYGHMINHDDVSVLYVNSWDLRILVKVQNSVHLGAMNVVCIHLCCFHKHQNRHLNSEAFNVAMDVALSQHLNHSASSNAFTVFYAAATALEMPV
jgi:hypothetical protein